MAHKAPSPWYFACPTGGIINTTAVNLVAPVAAVALQNGAANSTQRQFCSALQFINTSAVNSEIVILDTGNSNAVVWRGYAAASAAKGEEVNFDPPLQSSPSGTLAVQLVITGTATRVSAQGFTDV